MRVLITGGAGFIGSHLADVHIDRGDEVTVLDDFSTGQAANIEHLETHPRFRLIVGSVLNRSLLGEAMAGCDRIYHLAAAVGVKYIIDHPLHSLRVNILGTETVLDLANERKIPVYIASTSEVYGKTEKIPFSEGDDRVLGSTRVSRWGYANTKATDEFLSLAYYREKGLPVIIGRFFNTVGPRQSGRYGMVIPRFVKAALLGHPLTVFGTGEQTRCFLDVEDAVRFVLALFDSGNAFGDVFNIGSTERISILDLAYKVKEMTGSSSEIEFVPYEKAYEQGFEDMLHRVPDMTKFENAVGLKPKYSLEEILGRVIEYYRR
ncbi:MAG: NAD-dependent epimerase/dehydratase family protein [Candidatus Hydrogenedentota bacterium]|nr:MAG: NAD-dependent epimerase/dehydratase family protein [Candidatus Hydrogenedentota bacterium]